MLKYIQFINENKEDVNVSELTKNTINNISKKIGETNNFLNKIKTKKTLDDVNIEMGKEYFYPQTKDLVFKVKITKLPYLTEENGKDIYKVGCVVVSKDTESNLEIDYNTITKNGIKTKDLVSDYKNVVKKFNDFKYDIDRENKLKQPLK